ncbi:MAG: dynamin family protein, partial [Myxococcota bacterium]
MSLQHSEGSLSRYIEIREELVSDLKLVAGMLRKDQAEEGGDALTQTVLQRIEDRLRMIQDDRLTVGIFGETCSGKSTTLNCLSRREVTRPDVVSNTGSLMEFTYGQQEELSVQYLDGRVEATHWEELPQFTDQMHNPQNQKRVERVKIRLPLPYLKNGIRFFDTPGLNDVIQSYTDLSTRFLDEMGAVIVTSLYPPFTRGEMDFLKRASHQCSKMFIVINLSQDYWTQRERLRERLIFNISQDRDLAQHPDLRADKLRVYVLNAKQAWSAIQQDDLDTFEASGFSNFQRDLEQFLAQDASRAILASSIRNSFEVVTLLQKLLTLRAEVLFTKRSEIEDKIKDVQDLHKKAELKKYELFDAIDDEVRRLQESVEPELLSMLDETASRLEEIQEQPAFGKMVNDLEELYHQNLEHGNVLEKMIAERIEDVFQAAHRWMYRQLDELLSLGDPADVKQQPDSFVLSRDQRSFLGMFDSYEDQLGMAEAVLGLTTVSASMAAGGKGIAILSFLGPLAFPVGGVGGFMMGLFARNYMKTRQLRQHIAQQQKSIEEGKKMLHDKVALILDRVTQGIKHWVARYFDTLFTRMTRMMEEHRDKLGQEGYLEQQR